jgi:Subtilase family
MRTTPRLQVLVRATPPRGEDLADQIAFLLDPERQEEALLKTIARHAGGRLKVDSYVDRGSRILLIEGALLVREVDREAALAHSGQRFRARSTAIPGIACLESDCTATELVAVTRSLSGVGIEASFNHITQFSMRGKSAASPRVMSDALAPRPVSHAGAGTVVAVIDTGIDARAAERTDGWLDDITVNHTNIDPLNDVSWHYHATLAMDHAAGHGTFVAGVARQVAPGADVRVYRALDSDGLGSEEAVGATILAAAAEGANVINLSLGQESLDDRPPLGIGTALDLLDPEVVVVAAAGNSPDRRPTWPAAFPNVTAVASMGEDMTGSGWSKRGVWVDVSTCGEGILSTFVASHEDPAGCSENPCASWTGTSFAAPQVAGRIAATAGAYGSSRAARDALMEGASDPDWGSRLRIL